MHLSPLRWSEYERSCDRLDRPHGFVRAYRGAFNDTEEQALAAHAISHAVERAGVDRNEIEDVVTGVACIRETSVRTSRQSALRAGLPDGVVGITVDRQCASGLMAIAIAANQIATDGQRIAVGGGLEPISLVQNERMNMDRAFDPWLRNSHPGLYFPMLRTAEVVAERYGVSREAQDEYSLPSQTRTAKAQDLGLFDDLVPFACEESST